MKTDPFKVKPIPADWPVQPAVTGADLVTCGHCGLSWDDAIVTSMTPAPAARCPFEAFHVYREPEPIDIGTCQYCGDDSTEIDKYGVCNECQEPSAEPNYDGYETDTRGEHDPTL